MEQATGGWSRYGASQEDGVGKEQDTGGWNRLKLDTGGWGCYGSRYGSSQ